MHIITINVAESMPCITIILGGGGRMGCKTQAEWKKLGSIQCGIRVALNGTYQHSTKVRKYIRTYKHYKLSTVGLLFKNNLT